MAPAQPELKKYLDKRLFVQLNGSRKVIGVLRGYDVFLNIVLDEAVEEKEGGEKVRIGMVVIRGNSVVMLEALERIGGDDRNHQRTTAQPAIIGRVEAGHFYLSRPAQAFSSYQSIMRPPYLRTQPLIPPLRMTACTAVSPTSSK
ncbi:small nuclear ribonucleoprotein [Colletotrichum limetticola]|nr:small nuclear ribonucleoprotein [Colletotrichum limetticola]